MSKSNFKTPGIYVEEVNSFPPSVVEVSSAVPAFLGYTEKAPGDFPAIRRITSLNDFQLHFGGSFPVNFNVTLKGDKEKSLSKVELTDPDSMMPQYLMRYNLELYFKNGGGPCYIVSVGKYGAAPKTNKDFEGGLKALELEDEPTLLVLSDALGKGNIYMEVAKMALDHCKKMQDRFCILDVPMPLNATDARSTIKAFRSGIGTKALSYGAAYFPFLQTTIPLDYDEEKTGTVDQVQSIVAIKTSDNALYYQIISELGKYKAILPPGPALAGVYTSMDNSRGVWKAPANVSLSGVIAPQEKISHQDQEFLNVDVESGKSVNAIRTFPGKGVMVWGGRTLLGNDNDWRYISVRRLFIIVEESLRKATQFAVFEPNEAGTWLKVKSMIDSYLYGLWKQGAMAGESQDQAYFINIGLGVTMTPQDILEGKMIVEVGLAPVRPAEFILLKFSQILQQS